MNILLAYNDTDVSNRALERAAQLAKLYEAKLIVTSVTPVLVGATTNSERGTGTGAGGRASTGTRDRGRARRSDR